MAPFLACLGLSFSGCVIRAEPRPPIDQAARYAKPLGPIEWLAHSDRFRPIAPDDRYALVPDSWLQWRVESILADPEMPGSGVRVTVEKQNVVLTGRVRSREDEENLMEAIKGIHGVAHIEDLMTVEP